MDIETLQIKRVTGNWSKEVTYPDGVGHQYYIPSHGEPVMINTSEASFEILNNDGEPIVISSLEHPILILGDGNSTLRQLMESSGYHIATISSVAVAINYKIQNLKPTTEPPYVGTTSSIGTSSKFALEDHKHGMTKDQMEAILGTTENSFNCRRIKFGTSDPTAQGSNVGGVEGDIYIRYEVN